jgi:stage V sporulation protein B
MHNGSEIIVFHRNIGSLLCYVCITVLNLIAMARVLPQAPRILRSMLRSVVAALIMGVVVFCVYYGMEAFLPPVSRIISCGLPIAVGGCVYVVAAIKCKAITREDCLLLPKGEKIANLLRL